MGANVIAFPTARRMPTRVAEMKIGGFLTHRYPPLRSVQDGDLWAWLDKWLRTKRVVTGWWAVNNGLVSAFKRGRVAHFVGDVCWVDVDEGKRPKVELMCESGEYSVFNWVAPGDAFSGDPVIILGTDQVPYFRLCRDCEAAFERRTR